MCGKGDGAYELYTEMIFDECVALLREIFRNNFVESVDFLGNFNVNLE